MIKVENLSFSYTESPFISDMNFSVSEGEIFGFLGPFGASIYRQPPQPRINQGFLETRKLNLKPYNHMVNAFSTRNGRFSLSGLTGKGLIKWQYSG